jgi:hypothetical protein
MRGERMRKIRLIQLENDEFFDELSEEGLMMHLESMEESS